MPDPETQASEIPAQEAPQPAQDLSPPEAAPQTYDPQYVAQLEAAANHLYQENQRYTKYKDRLERFESDPDFDSFYSESARFYEDGKKRRETQEEAPSWFKPYAQAIDEFRSDRNSTVEQRKQVEQAELDSFYNSQRQYAAKLSQEYKMSQSDLADLAVYADSLARARGKRVGLEEAFRTTQKFGTQQPGLPPVLKGDSGVSGVPSVSPPDVKKNMKTADGRRGTILSYLREKA